MHLITLRTNPRYRVQPHRHIAPRRNLGKQADITHVLVRCSYRSNLLQLLSDACTRGLQDWPVYGEAVESRVLHLPHGNRRHGSFWLEVNGAGDFSWAHVQLSSENTCYRIAHSENLHTFQSNFIERWEMLTLTRPPLHMLAVTLGIQMANKLGGVVELDSYTQKYNRQKHQLALASIFINQHMEVT